MRRQRGEGCYDYIEAKKIWRWRGYYRDQISGENKRKEITATTKKSLRQKVNKWQDEVAAGQTNRIKVSAWCEKWLSIVKNTTKPTTYRNYAITAHCHIIKTWGNLYLDQVNTGMIQDYINSLTSTHKQKTILTIRAHIRTCLATSIEYGFLLKNPAQNLKISKKNLSEKIVLTKEEADKLINFAKAKAQSKTDDANRYLNLCYYIILRLALATGMRQGELFGLNWGNINFLKNIILVENSLTQIKSENRISDTKTHKIRNVMIYSRTISLLKCWKKFQKGFANRYPGIYENSYNLVFTNSLGRFISATNFSKRYFRPLLKEAGISEDFHFHGLRHTHASMLLARGVNPQIVSERLGHSSVTTTMNIYAHILPTLQDTAKSVLENLFNNKLEE